MMCVRGGCECSQQVLRERAKSLERAQRVVVMQLNLVHSIPPTDGKCGGARSVLIAVPQHLRSVYPLFGDARAVIADLARCVPEGQYYRWCDIWSWAMRNLVFAACLSFYLGTGHLLSKEDTERVLGVDALPNDRMMLATEEYLHGLISMANELPRLAVNAVTVGDYAAPVRISVFVKQLHSAFQVLNLKNDALRKRFDGMKYDVKRIEEIIYDISLRGLTSRDTTDAHGIGAAAPKDVETDVLSQLTGA